MKLTMQEISDLSTACRSYVYDSERTITTRAISPEAKVKIEAEIGRFNELLARFDNETMGELMGVSERKAMKPQHIGYALISAAVSGALIFKVLDVHWTFAAVGALCAATTVMVLAQRQN